MGKVRLQFFEIPMKLSWSNFGHSYITEKLFHRQIDADNTGSSSSDEWNICECRQEKRLDQAWRLKNKVWSGPYKVKVPSILSFRYRLLPSASIVRVWSKFFIYVMTTIICKFVNSRSLYTLQEAIHIHKVYSCWTLPLSYEVMYLWH